jgi:maleate isomerase
MTRNLAAVRRIGLLLPSSNTVVEPESQSLIPQDGSVTLHFSRFRVTVISDDSASSRQFEMESMLQPALLLADAKVDRIAWAGTAASWLGFDRDDELVGLITGRTRIPATTAVLAINAHLCRLGARRLGLVTPYIEALEQQIKANYRAWGAEVVASRRLNLTVNTDYAAVGPDTIEAMCRDVASARPDAIVIMCTNLGFARQAGTLSVGLGIPVIDSVAATLDACMN